MTAQHGNKPDPDFRKSSNDIGGLVAFALITLGFIALVLGIFTIFNAGVRTLFMILGAGTTGIGGYIVVLGTCIMINLMQHDRDIKLLRMQYKAAADPSLLGLDTTNH